MSAVRTYSPASSAGSSSTDSACLPQHRIQCSKHKVAVGGRRYDSASEALQAYLQQFEGTVNGEVGNNGQESPTKLFTSPVNTSPATSDKGVTGLLSSTSALSPRTKPPPVPGNQKDMPLSTAKSMAASGLLVGTNGLKVAGAKEDVEDLLTSKVSPKLQEEVTDTLREVKLRHLLKQAALKSQSKGQTGLQQEVEAALTRSAQLLERVTRENMAAARKGIENGSEISSTDIPTEILLSDSSLSLNGSELDAEEKPSRPTYSPHKPRPPRPSSNSSLLSQSLCAPVSYRTPHQSRARTRRPSIDSLLPPPSHNTSSRLKRSSSSSSASLSNQSDPTDILRRIRSRSVSPGQRQRLAAGSAPDWVEQLDCSVKKSVPSWVGELSPSEASESLWAHEVLLQNKDNKRPNGVPSWIHEVEKSDITVDDVSNVTGKFRSPSVLKVTPKTNRKRDGLNIDQCDHDVSHLTSDSRPGLNYSDLMTSLPQTPNGGSKHVTFTESLRDQNDSSTRQRQQQPHSLPLPEGQTSTPLHPSLSRPAASKMFDSDFNGEAFLRNNILPQTARLKKSIDNFVSSSENLQRKHNSSSSSDTGSDCKSLDTLALLSGKPLSRADITGASSIPKDSNMASKSFSTSPTVSPVNPAGSPVMTNGHDQDSSDGLDGDRPWERVTSTFKAPVPVDDADCLGKSLSNRASPAKGIDNTLSGGKQPGSMEALKNMLFKLQAEETSNQEGTTVDKVALDQSQESQSSAGMAMIPALQGYDFKMEPGGHSLEKALVHLNRLKKLVKTNSEEQGDGQGAHSDQSS
ncbi:uncharacterized protein LOC101849746 isoform X2 [Aplysia californica]|uniref:Uncharacterized protein LOC101849746 isoform X2 n=1 Tax=Aplysia californica TaxID=6500 RepID=A0ABM1W290_APLCA|nr:uncharacterized protein LOC101849746 isoform X2 [Aplysia californica]